MSTRHHAVLGDDPTYFEPNAGLGAVIFGFTVAWLTESVVLDRFGWAAAGFGLLLWGGVAVLLFVRIRMCRIVVGRYGVFVQRLLSRRSIEYEDIASVEQSRGRIETYDLMIPDTVVIRLNSGKAVALFAVLPRTGIHPMVEDIERRWAPWRHARAERVSAGADRQPLRTLESPIMQESAAGTEWKAMAAAGMRPRNEEFPDETVQLINGHIGDSDLRPGPDAIVICEIYGDVECLIPFTETFYLDIVGSGPWTYLLYRSRTLFISPSNSNDGGLLARVTWNKLDPLGGGLKLWTCWYKGDLSCFAPYAVSAGPCFETAEVEAAFADVQAEWDWIFNPRKYPERFLRFAVEWLPWTEEADRLDGAIHYDAVRTIEKIPDAATKIGSVWHGKNYSSFHYLADGSRLLLFREDIYRRLHEVADLWVPYKCEYKAIGEVPCTSQEDAGRKAVLALIRLRIRLDTIEYPTELRPDALKWMLGDDKIMARCRQAHHAQK